MVAILIFVALFLGALVALVVVTFLFAPRRPSEIKERRFEAGGRPMDLSSGVCLCSTSATFTSSR